MNIATQSSASNGQDMTVRAQNGLQVTITIDNAAQLHPHKIEWAKALLRDLVKAARAERHNKSERKNAATCRYDICLADFVEEIALQIVDVFEGRIK